jgi:hypothetical protein
MRRSEKSAHPKGWRRSVPLGTYPRAGQDDHPQIHFGGATRGGTTRATCIGSRNYSLRTTGAPISDGSGQGAIRRNCSWLRHVAPFHEVSSDGRSRTIRRDFLEARHLSSPRDIPSYGHRSRCPSGGILLSLFRWVPIQVALLSFRKEPIRRRLTTNRHVEPFYASAADGRILTLLVPSECRLVKKSGGIPSVKKGSH